MPGASERTDDIFRPRFEAAFDTHHADVLAFALRRVDGRAAADDVVADTFAIVWRKRDTIPNTPLPWIYGIARRVIANQRRSAKRRLRLNERLAGQPIRDQGLDPAEVVNLRESVLAAFARLSEPEQEVLRLVAWDGIAAEAAARVLGCSTTAFRMRLHRARRELRRELEAGDASPPAARSATATAPTTEEAR